MSAEDFHKYWRDVHAPIVLRLPGVTRYVQNRPVAIPGREPPYDGVAEVWFEDLETLRSAHNSEAWQDVIADETNFMGHPTKGSIALTVEEDEVPVPGRGPQT